MDHLFWRIVSNMDNHSFKWIIWYIGKSRNSMVFDNIDVDPKDIIKLAETEAATWLKAHASLSQ